MKEMRFLNHIVCSLLVVVFIQNTQAQTNETQLKKWTWGVKSGINTAHLHNLLLEMDSVGLTAQKRIDFIGNLFLTRQFNPYFSMQAELSFTSKGMNFTDPPVSLYTDEPFIFFRLNYLELPIMAKFSLPLKSVNYYLSVGVAPAYALKAKQILPIIEANMPFPRYEHRPWPEARRFDANALIALGVSFSTPKQHAFLFEVRYTQGLVNVLPENNQILNGVVSYMLGYQF